MELRLAKGLSDWTRWSGGFQVQVIKVYQKHA